MKIVNKKIILKYMIRGFLWGLIFPIIATIYEINANNLEFSKENLLIINDNKLLTFIYLTPFFISLISYHAARAFIKMTELNLSLAENSKALLDSKNKLEKTYELLEKKNEDLHHSNIYDKLTGLKKEEGLLNDLNMETDESIILCIINLSYFREINTLFGYQVGDELSKSFAERLKENEYTSYRLHGDEFAIVHYDEADSLEIDVFINYIFNLICDEVFLIDKNRIYLTINVGVATSNKNNEISKKQLFENAYFALKYAKERKIQYALYNEDLISNAENLYSYYWKEKILLAIQNKSVIAFYQPIINNVTLYPEKYEYRSIMNAKVITNLLNRGDNAELEREVDHWFYFKSNQNRELFIKEVSHLGYEVVSQDNLEEDEHPYKLYISHNNNILWDNVDNYVWELVELVEKYEGILLQLTKIELN